MKTDLLIIKEALTRYSLEETLAISKAMEKVAKPSEGFFDNLDKRVEKIKRDREKTLSFKKAIIALIAATLIISCLSVVVYAISERTKIGGFFVEWFEDHIELVGDGNDKDENIFIENVIIGYIPDGFVIVDEDFGYDWKCYEWKNDTSRIYKSCSIVYNGVTDFNTENNNFEIITLGSLILYKAEYATETYFVWTDSNVEYSLDSNNVEWDELVKIIEGISYEDATA